MKDICNQCRGLGCMKCAGSGFLESQEQYSFQGLPANKDSVIQWQMYESCETPLYSALPVEIRIHKEKTTYQFTYADNAPRDVRWFSVRIDGRGKSFARFVSHGVPDISNSEVRCKWLCEFKSEDIWFPMEFQVGKLYDITFCGKVTWKHEV